MAQRQGDSGGVASPHDGEEVGHRGAIRALGVQVVDLARADAELAGDGGGGEHLDKWLLVALGGRGSV